MAVARSTQIQVRLTVEQRDALQERAQKLGISVSELIRSKVFNEPATPPNGHRIVKNDLPPEVIATIEARAKQIRGRRGGSSQTAFRDARSELGY